MSKGKSRAKIARHDIMRTNAANARRRVRQQQARARYDKQAYDKPAREEE